MIRKRYLTASFPVLKCNFPSRFVLETFRVPSRIAFVLWPSPFPQHLSLRLDHDADRELPGPSAFIFAFARSAHSILSFFPGLKSPRELADALCVCFSMNARERRDCGKLKGEMNWPHTPRAVPHTFPSQWHFHPSYFQSRQVSRCKDGWPGHSRGSSSARVKARALYV
jgi:hypothetical protein